MIPSLLIIIFASAGFLVNGLLGLVLGAALGYLVNYILGVALLIKSKGLVPYSERQAVARDMIKEDWKIVEEYSGHSDVSAATDFIANDIEQIFRESFEINNTPKNYWLSYPVISGMIRVRVDESVGLEKKYNQLLRGSIKIMYPGHRN